MPLQVSLVKQIKTNNTFRMLWFDYITEANQYQSIKNYTPSEKFIAHYSLVKEKKNVIVPLLLQIDKDFDYKQLDNLKKNIIPIVIGIFTGCIVSFALVSLCVFIFEIDVVLHYSLLPKSITIPMGMELSRIIGGIPSITIASIVITGITGGVVAPIVCKVCKIKHPVAQGIAIGTSAHAIGTAKALEMGEVQGAMSSLAIGVCGVFTTILTPILLHFWAH